MATTAACVGGAEYHGSPTPLYESLPTRQPTPPSFYDPPLPSDQPPPPLPSSPQPDFGQTVTLAKAPPPLGPASLIIVDNGTTAVVTDPDRDRVAIANLATKAAVEVPLTADDVPGRLVDDSAHRVHVVLDRAGAVATIDLTNATVIGRRQVCAAPHGITRVDSTLYVACEGGEIVTLSTDPAGPAPQVLARLDKDLRDVVAIGDDLFVSRLRSAEVLRVKRADGSVRARASRGPDFTPFDKAAIEPAVGWRLTRAGSDSVVLVHQMARSEMVDVQTPSAYGSSSMMPCSGVVPTTITRFLSNGEQIAAAPHAFLAQAVVPIDIAQSPDGDHWAVIAAGNGHSKGAQQIFLLNPSSSSGATQCLKPPPSFNGTEQVFPDPPGQAVAAAFTSSNSLVVFTREPAALHIRPVSVVNTFTQSAWTTIALGGPSREDTGHAVFHSNAGGGIACVSCHPGGADDGRVWQLSSGTRRTQTLQGTIEGTAPYHWGGDAPGMEMFATEVFAKRMGGPFLDSFRVAAMKTWLERLPAAHVSAPTDTAAAARGKILFESAAVGCTSCHSGSKLTNNESVDVGTGGTFQVPSLLGVGLHAPYLHDGRAATLLDRFTAVGGGDTHGQTSTLSEGQVKDLVMYLESL